MDMRHDTKKGRNLGNNRFKYEIENLDHVLLGPYFEDATVDVLSSRSSGTRLLAVPHVLLGGIEHDYYSDHMI